MTGITTAEARLRPNDKPPTVSAMSSESTVLARLMAVIESRKSSSAEASYTASLLAGGVERIGAKIIEEAGEVVDAAREPGDAGRAHVTHEAADLVYHLLVLLAHRELAFSEVEAALVQRFGVSGLDEKASRKA